MGNFASAQIGGCGLNPCKGSFRAAPSDAEPSRG
uniref:Uncharacterized protein n=1 Tax=Arundo donax TaxID=35708 RepID=A0A0A9CIY7_ARUDO